MLTFTLSPPCEAMQHNVFVFVILSTHVIFKITHVVYSNKTFCVLPFRLASYVPRQLRLRHRRLMQMIYFATKHSLFAAIKNIACLIIVKRANTRFLDEDDE